MVKNIILLVSIVLCGISMSFSQNIKKPKSVKSIEIQGKVIAEDDNEPVPGVAIFVKDTSNGVATDFDGNFKIYVNIGDILTLSCLGFRNTEYTITSKEKVYNLFKAEYSVIRPNNSNRLWRSGKKRFNGVY